jgi:hypothetical protein
MFTRIQETRWPVRIALTSLAMVASIAFARPSSPRALAERSSMARERGRDERPAPPSPCTCSGRPGHEARAGVRPPEAEPEAIRAAAAGGS